MKKFITITTIRNNIYSVNIETITSVAKINTIEESHTKFLPELKDYDHFTLIRQGLCCDPLTLYVKEEYEDVMKKIEDALNN